MTSNLLYTMFMEGLKKNGILYEKLSFLKEYF